MCRTLDASGMMPGGLLLIGANATIHELTFAQIEAELTSMMAELTSTAATPPAAGSSA